MTPSKKPCKTVSLHLLYQRTKEFSQTGSEADWLRFACSLMNINHGDDDKVEPIQPDLLKTTDLMNSAKAVSMLSFSDTNLTGEQTQTC